MIRRVIPALSDLLEGERTADDPALLLHHHQHQRAVLRKAPREVVKNADRHA